MSTRKDRHFIDTYTTTSAVPWTKDTTPLTSATLTEFVRKFKETRPPRYRVHRAEGVTQWIAFDGKLFTTAATIDALKRFFTAAQNQTMPPMFVFAFDGFAVHAVEQHALAVAAMTIEHGGSHAEITRALGV